MMLTQLCAKEFGSGDRGRGDAPSLQQRIQLTHVGDGGAFAIAEGSYGEDYVVAIDFANLDDNELGVACECMRFNGGDYCKHIWGTLRKIERSFDLKLHLSGRVRLHDVDASLVDVGEPIQPTTIQPTNRSRHAPRSTSSPRPPVTQPILDRASQASQSVSSTHPEIRVRPQSGVFRWKEVLHSIAAGHDSEASFSEAIPADVFQEAQVAKQHWFVLSLADERNQTGLVLQTMLSTRDSRGQWGRPQITPVSSTTWATCNDPVERAAMALLEPIVDTAPQSLGYLRWSSGAATTNGSGFVGIKGAVLAETLVALHRTGRFQWSLDAAGNPDSMNPIESVDSGTAFKLQFELIPHPDKGTQVQLRPQLCRDQNRLPISRVMLASDAGTALIQDAPAEQSPATDDASDIDITPVARLVPILPHEAAMIRMWQRAGQLVAPARSLRSLLTQFETMHHMYELTVAPELQITETQSQPVGQCFLRQREPGSPHFDAAFHLRESGEVTSGDDLQWAFDSPRTWWWNADSRTIVRRNHAKENEWLDSIPKDKFRVQHEDEFVPSLQISRDDFLPLVQHLQTAGWNIAANGARVRTATQFDIAVESGIDWFDVNGSVEFDGISVSLPELLAALQHGQDTVVLDDGTEGLLPEQWLKRFAGLEANGEQTDAGLRFGRTQALLVEAMLAEHDDVQTDDAFADFCTKLKSFNGIATVNASDDFQGQLRDYQRIGLGWFEFLREFRFGGCLADDMGLGKTIQILAMLQKRVAEIAASDETRLPSIIVVPKSLIFNWIDEASKFTPELNVFNATGTDRHERYAAIDPDSPPDIILTTYGTLRNDAARWRESEFDYVILDEAQAIKNPQSLSAKCSRLLRGRHRLAMTGTPVENHLGDLWSLFDFLNPGMIGRSNVGASARTFELDDEEQQRQLQQISQSLRPFILRRTKQQVLTELPDKTEQTLTCEMTAGQRKMYNELRDHYRLHLSQKIKELGIQRSKIHVLEALLRLRQAACDPRLVDPKCDVRGAKIESLMLQLEELIGEGHKVLVFSQFVKLLGLVRGEIESRGWTYEYLDGKTRHRSEHVRRFQEDEDCKLFLISLKAGGNGLNLTAADYVYILDPWWNPAVEAQAIDRAHRMGQTQRVMAYRMICGDTVEQKIIELQQSKRDLADAIISQDKSLISGLTADDLTNLMT